MTLAILIAFTFLLISAFFLFQQYPCRYLEERAVMRASKTMGYLVVIRPTEGRAYPTDMMADLKATLEPVGTWGKVYNAYVEEVGLQRHLKIDVLTVLDLETGLPVDNAIYCSKVLDFSNCLRSDGRLHLRASMYYPLMSRMEKWSQSVVAGLREEYPDQEIKVRKGDFYL